MPTILGIIPVNQTKIGIIPNLGALGNAKATALRPAAGASCSALPDSLEPILTPRMLIDSARLRFISRGAVVFWHATDERGATEKMTLIIYREPDGLEVGNQSAAVLELAGIGPEEAIVIGIAQKDFPEQRNVELYVDPKQESNDAIGWN